MLLNFHNLEQPKRIAKLLAKHTPAKLAASQAVLAKLTGYRDWHDLSKSWQNGSGIAPFEAIAIDEQAMLIVETANSLQVEVGDVQFAFSESGAFKALSSYEHQLALRALCFRLTSIPYLGGLNPGDVGMAKPWGQPVLLKREHSGARNEPVHCISHKHWRSLLGGFEFNSPKEQLPLFIPRRLYVLYGMWIEQDGSKVLYSRDYEPIWRIRDGKRPERTELSEQIQPVRRIGFWDDTSTPWQNENRYAEEIQRISDYGITGLPRKVDLLAKMVCGELDGA